MLCCFSNLSRVKKKSMTTGMLKAHMPCLEEYEETESQQHCGNPERTRESAVIKQNFHRSGGARENTHPLCPPSYPSDISG
ncbi:MAG: hypothetical protein CM15mP8_4870 [Methanobacteriota archaeon]|nr:MAG: hypothetical protein CM15mP8_4870 [Euryarchaeota archaeon]